MAHKLFVFDLDDTLLYNKHNYSAPMLDAVKLIIQEVGPRAPYAPDIVALEDKIDKERVKAVDPVTDRPYLYNRRRFPGSLAETYKEVCRKTGTQLKGSVSMKLLAIGEQAFAKSLYKKNLHPRAKNVLESLLDKYDELILCSKGDKEVQEDKFSAIKELGIRNNYFKEWLIVDKKDSALFLDIKRRHPGYSSYYSVGNMYASDIAPALEAGYRGIYIPDEHWESSDSSVKIDLARCDVLEDLSQFENWYKGQEK